MCIKRSGDLFIYRMFKWIVNVIIFLKYLMHILVLDATNHYISIMLDDKYIDF